MMDGALAELASNQSLTMVLTGTETDGNKTHTFNAVLASSFSIANGQQLAQLELLDYRDNQLQRRVAADGVRFWDYDVRGKTYTSTEYGSGRFAGSERERLFQNMLRRLKGEKTFLARLMQDAYGGKLNARTAWLPWRPNASVSVQGDSIVCTTSIPNPNVLTYTLQREVGFGWSIASIDYYEETVISSRTRITRWNVAFYRDSIPQGTSWQFVPPAGSRALAVDEGG